MIPGACLRAAVRVANQFRLRFYPCDGLEHRDRSVADAGKHVAHLLRGPTTPVGRGPSRRSCRANRGLAGVAPQSRRSSEHAPEWVVTGSRRTAARRPAGPVALRRGGRTRPREAHRPLIELAVSTRSAEYLQIVGPGVEDTRRRLLFGRQMGYELVIVPVAAVSRVGRRIWLCDSGPTRCVPSRSSRLRGSGRVPDSYPVGVSR